MLHGMVKKIEAILYRYLSLEDDEVTPTSVGIISNKVVISSQHSYKRHVTKESWDEFSSYSIKHVTDKKNEKLGLAVGKVLAKNLIVKFEDTEFQREKP